MLSLLLFSAVDQLAMKPARHPCNQQLRMGASSLIGPAFGPRGLSMARSNILSPPINAFADSSAFSPRHLRRLPGVRSEMRNHMSCEQFLRLDRLPMLDTAGIDRDCDLSEPLAQLVNRFDPLNNILQRSNPNDVLLDHLVIRHIRKRFHNA